MKSEHYSSFNRRMMAATIDSLLALVTVAPLVDWLLSFFTSQDSGDDFLGWDRLQQFYTQTDPHAQGDWLRNYLLDWMIGSLAQTGGLLIATAICWKLWSATPGKLLLRMRIVDADTEAPMSDAQILWRMWGYVVACGCLFLGIFWIAFDKRRQGWHDKIAHTVVINLPKSASIAVDRSNSPAP